MTISQSKKVSVIVPNYNYGKYIKKRIKSILEQTYLIYELIILDDASTDGSADLIKNIVLDLKLKNPKMNIRFVPNLKNSGKAMAQWKRGLELAQGDYIWIAEADDLSNKRFLEEVMRGFDDPKVVISYTESMIINSHGLMIAPNFRWSRDKEKTGHYKNSYIKDGCDEIREIMAIRCTIPNVSSVVFRKSVVKFGDWEKALGFSQVGDWYLYVNVLERGKIAYSRKALNKFRIHGRSVTGQSKKGRRHYEEVLEMHKYFQEKYKLSERVIRAMKNEEARIREKYGI